jgi:hypothetical protein
MPASLLFMRLLRRDPARNSSRNRKHGSSAVPETAVIVVTYRRKSYENQ